jgi:hypothetical protein
MSSTGLDHSGPLALGVEGEVGAWRRRKSQGRCCFDRAGSWHWVADGEVAGSAAAGALVARAARAATSAGAPTLRAANRGALYIASMLASHNS